MCEIQLVKRLDNNNLSNRDLMEFIDFMSLGDIGNPHAFGLFNSKGVDKHKGKFNYMKLNDLFIMSDNFVVGHNRYATNRFHFFDYKPTKANKKDDGGIIRQDNPFFINASGNYVDMMCFNMFSLIKNKGKYKEDKIKERLKPETPKNYVPFNSNLNNHPFTLGDFIMVHNGVISNDDELKEKYKIKTAITTDSYVLLWLICKFFKNSKAKSRRDKTIDAITRATKKIDGGFSVVLFDKESKDMFYFKNDLTTFTFRKVGNKLLGSTNIDNFKYVYGIKRRDKEFLIPKAGVIYLISEFPLRELYVFDKYFKAEKKLKGGKK